ncbi:hypothetical protein DSM106972_025590 [Dulcicalothrix desertica PCC 7102]|uniref:Uncharacterized protein n=1 Tax=Dulcicalothrix desertica PCC 7102 TaxID=232991 RepID=A0A3S1CNJ2_9CYAN|nr:hypothetical protein [Dulcicalothrix desertica]RUT07298.1 hypothetical protein DSM106972_025590 [Dulcicalothrix desertica PCC 7102]TWH62110.1 hypothetical protein CAL7102_00807 [Dulcicalothrix desertica PCC 7102]
MTTYIMNDLESAKLGRSHYLAANILELQVLAKLYGIKPAGNEKYKVNWVDNLVAFMPYPTRIWNLGFMSNESKHCLADVLDGADLFCAVNTFNHPSVIEKAIIGRLIDINANWMSPRVFRIESDSAQAFYDMYRTMTMPEKQLLDKIWSIYLIKKYATETHWLLAKYWHVDKPNDSIQ